MVQITEETATEIMIDNEITEKLADFQKVALNQAIKLIREYGGCFVSDLETTNPLKFANLREYYN